MLPGLDRSAGFAPVASIDARVLILGSLPGRRSIAAAQYYAHPQNAFWRIMRDIVGAEGDYTNRCEMIMDSGIALWDVLANSVRPGSMDSDINVSTAEANDFERFLGNHEGIELIAFNGQKAAQLFVRSVEPGLKCAHFKMRTLPSTSPAYASMNYVEKLRQWRATICDDVGRPD
jgi:TDG/mug DNA glycosylase family protein